MSISQGSIIRYADLIDGVYSYIKPFAKNIGAYSTDVPEQLKYPYTMIQPITVQTGNTPKVVWTNSKLASVVPESTVLDQYNSFCTKFMLNNNSHKDTIINLGDALTFLTGVFCFIQSKFATVNSHLTSSTCIFYISSNAIDESKVSQVKPFNIMDTTLDSLIANICGLAISSTKSLSVIEGYTLLLS